MSKDRGDVHTKPGEVQVQHIADPKFENRRGRKIEHGVILKVVRPTSADPISTWSAAAQVSRQAWCSGTRSGVRLS
jgi:hypothetical protein